MILPGTGLVVTLVIAAFLGLFLFVKIIPLPLWISAYFSGVSVSLGTLIGMRLRRVPPQSIILPLISARKAGLDISINNLEAHYLAGGNVTRVVNALISADKAGLNLTFKQATSIDLAGRNVCISVGPDTTVKDADIIVAAVTEALADVQ